MDALQGGLLGGGQCAAAGRGSQRHRVLRPPSPANHLVGRNKMSAFRFCPCFLSYFTAPASCAAKCKHLKDTSADIKLFQTERLCRYHVFLEVWQHVGRGRTAQTISSTPCETACCTRGSSGRREMKSVWLPLMAATGHSVCQPCSQKKTHLRINSCFFMSCESPT